MNVVFGRNEAGKTTFAQFVGGVLFGWEEARGQRNTYKPDNAERAGTLFFANEDGSGDSQASRIRNVDGLQGDTSVVDDIDRETYRTMFSLTSDELRQLRNTTDVTAKLLTAGSGTGASPAHALTALQERLAQFTSRAAASEKSLVKLESEQDELRRRIAAESDRVERLKREDHEFAELKPQRDELLAKIGDLNTAIETLKANRKTLEKTEADEAELEEKIADLRAQEESLRCEHRLAQREHPEELAGITATEERHLRDPHRGACRPGGEDGARRRLGTRQLRYFKGCLRGDARDSRRAERGHPRTPSAARADRPFRGAARGLHVRGHPAVHARP